ncbi:hypothetical protein Tco_1307381 [Tanacetum coccineum]
MKITQHPLEPCLITRGVGGKLMSTWMKFGGNTRDLSSILEETGQEYNFTPKEGLKNKSQMVETASGKLATPSGSASDRIRKKYDGV